MDEATRSDMQQWTGCVAGALTREEFERALSAAGLVDIEIHETHRVHEHAAAAIVRAAKPSGVCSAPTAGIVLRARCEGGLLWRSDRNDPHKLRLLVT